MARQSYKYIIVGGGLAGASAVKGVRERDPDGSVLLLAGEKHMPYDRPPLSKKLWFGRLTVDDIFLHKEKYYEQAGVKVLLGTPVASVDPAGKAVTVSGGQTFGYDKLLLATGGVPRRLAIPGGDLNGVCYFRTLDDYQRTRAETAAGKSAVVIGGGFIGSEIAAALAINKVQVTMVFPSAYLCNRVLPAELGYAVQLRFHDKGVRILSADRPTAITRGGGRFVTRTQNGQQVESDLVIVGIGVSPSVELAQAAGLTTDNGIVVNELLQTSSPDIYAAGDNARFPYQALGMVTRVEHWDNALTQGQWAGRNMAGAAEPYTHLPYFFSDLFEFGYEAVGEVSSDLETFADWQENKLNDTGVVYYLRDHKVRGAMMCNVWGKVDAARRMILEGKHVAPKTLVGVIR